MIGNMLGTLLPGMMADCRRLVPVTDDASDGQFGAHIHYAEGTTFRAALIRDQSTEARLAEAKGLRERYAVVTESDVALHYHDAFRRVSDGAVFRVVSNAAAAPAASGVQIARVSAERWVLPS